MAAGSSQSGQRPVSDGLSQGNPACPCRRYFICDNMLWGGRVVNDRSHPTTRGVLELTRLVLQAPNLYTTILRVRDGVSVSLKLS